MSLGRFLFIAALFVFCNPAWSASWEEESGKYFEEGDLDAVKRVLAEGAYSGALLIDALSLAIRSGNVDLVKYLDTRGWLKACRKDRQCDPILSAVPSKNRQMLAFMLSQGFPPTRDALFQAAAQADFDAVKLLCEKGASPAGKKTWKEEKSAATRTGPTVLEELERRIAEPRMNLGSPIRSASGTAAEAQIAAFFSKGLCKAGAAASPDFNVYLKEVRAFQDGNLGAVKEFQARRGDAHHDPYAETYLLYEAIASPNADLLPYLKNQGWLERCRARADCRPVDAAAEAGADSEVFALLLAEGFEADTYNTSHGTPLLYAAINGRADAVRVLCQHGADFRKIIKLEILELSIIDALRETYSGAWCAAVQNGVEKSNATAAERCADALNFNVPISECMPGSTCLSVPFPPKASPEATQRLMALSEVFQYFKNARCASEQAGQCAKNTAKFGTVIGDNVTLRSEPDQTSDKRAALPFGAVVYVTDSARNCTTVAGKTGRWIKIRVKRFALGSSQQETGSEGWVFDTYIDYMPAARERFEH